jgi:uncharacterized coiled-coil protein SlyX
MSDISNYLQSIEDRIDAIDTCEMLSEIADDIKAELQQLLDDLTERQADLTLQTVPPTDLATTIAWITAQINATVKPIEEMIAETALIIAKITEIITKLTNKISTLGCSFPPPSIP